MLLDWSREFDAQYDRLEADESSLGVERFNLMVFMLKRLQEQAAAPAEDTAMIKHVRQSRKYRVWRVSHPYRDGIALRLICWYPPETPDTVVVALFAGDKAGMGDVFYDSVGTRADQMIDRWIAEKEA
jgi:hypothetical protein